ncbi:MAG: hypothetical protein AAF658_00390 [Myxococcota bacterium]
MGPRAWSRVGRPLATTASSRGASFNEAATKWSRMGGKPSGAERSVLPVLQWGRDRMVADGIMADDAVDVAARASMGPRLNGRGWRTSPPRVHARCSRFNGAAT